MGIINGNIVGDAIDAITGEESGTNIEDFLSKFNSSSTKLVDQINPLNTFDVFFKFKPNIADGSLDRGDRLKKFGANLLNNLVENIPLIDSIVNYLSIKNENHIQKERNTFAADPYNTDKSFMEYLAKANLLVGGDLINIEQSNIPLELQLSLYVQSITVPKLNILNETKATTILGEYPINGLCIQPDSNKLLMDIINTKLPLIERLFYPWMREVTLPYWSYDSQPYTTATITIDFKKHTDIQYIFYGCRPTSLDMIQPTQEINSNLTRQVQFAFDFMFIKSKSLPVSQSLVDKLTSGLKGIN